MFYHDLYQASFSTSGGAAGASIVSHVAAGSASAPRPRTGMGGGRSAPSTTTALDHTLRQPNVAQDNPPCIDDFPLIGNLPVSYV